MRCRLEYLRDRNKGLYVASRPADVYCDVQSGRGYATLLLVDKLVDKECTASSRSCTLRRTVFRSIVLELIEPVLQLRRVPMEFDSDLAKGIDPAGTLRFFVMIPPLFLLAAEIERHCAFATSIPVAK